jgi:ribosomal protein L10|tara:strand:+ start:8476 stop:9315 length:840 start_codon:yes stop_codon:yes gene_type:complete
MKTETKISEEKVNIVKELSDLIKEKKTMLIASIKNLPASQFQEISKKLRGKAVIKVPKKNLILRAIDDSGKEKAKEIKEYVDESIAILFSNLDSFELASELIGNKSPAKAKSGQEALEDIEVQEGPTELLPGPAISELGALGIQIQIEKGKITIKKPKVIAKKGSKISADAVSIMNKLDIKPFSIGFIPLVAFDTKEEKLYSEINVNKEEVVNEIKTLFGKSLAFAVEIKYFSEDTIKFLIAKASIDKKALESLLSKEKPKKEEVKEENAPTENQEEKQ